MINLVAACPR
jgi:hypothetical protein